MQSSSVNKGRVPCHAKQWPTPTSFEPVSISVVRKYLSAIRAWHIAQGWAPPLSEADHECINWSLCGLENIQGNRKSPLWPPITIPMLRALRATLNLDDPFEACIWPCVPSGE